jgi:flagellar motility protein MotE (MotC chaperone)
MNAPEFPLPRSHVAQSPPVLRAPAVRVLPVLIFAAVAMLGFRIEVVVENITHARRTKIDVTTPAALAETTAPDKAAADKAAADKAAADKSAADKGAKPADAADAEPSAPAGADAKMAALPDPDTVQPGAAPAFNPSSLTKSEIETLQRLAERRDLIEKREHELDNREGLLKAGESRIDGKIAELHDLQKTIEGLLQKYDKQKQGEIDSLVKIYGAMKPKDAAGIFDSLDMPILVSVVQNMKEAKVAPIMALMSREKARALTEELSQRKQIGTAAAN